MTFNLSPATKTKLKTCALGVGALIVAILFITAMVYGTDALGVAIGKMRSHAGFLDYIPDVPVPCPSDYRCGGTSREQVAMENRLYRDLREGSKYALPETVTTDAYDVIATEAEPTSCMLQRAAKAKETPMPEGQYTPYDEIEHRFLERKKKAPLLAESALTSM